MNAVTYQELVRSDLKFLNNPAYLIVGNDAYLGEQCLSFILSKHKKFHSSEKITLYAEELTAPELNEHLDAYSLFSDQKVVIIKNCDKLKKEALDTLSDYYDSPSESQLVFVITPKIDSRFSAWKKIKDRSLHIECNPPRHGGEVRTWLDDELKTFNKSMSPKAKEEFISRCELDYTSINNELKKLFLLTCDKNYIDENDVATSMGTTRNSALTEFYRALGKKDIKNSINLVNRMLLAESEPIPIVYNLLRFYNLMWRINLLKQNHISEQEISGRHLMDVFPNQRKEYLESSRNYPLKCFPAIYEALLDLDSKLKLSAAEPAILFSLTILEIMK